MAAMTNLAPGGGDDGQGQATAVRDIRVWTRQGMMEVLTLPTSEGFFIDGRGRDSERERES